MKKMKRIGKMLYAVKTEDVKNRVSIKINGMTPEISWGFGLALAAFVAAMTITLFIPGASLAEDAVYSGGYTAPYCSSAVSPCNVPQSLINGRRTITGGVEPNQPNTVSTSPCQDGRYGTYHTDESLDSMIVYKPAGGPFLPGDTVRLEANVWCYSSASDNLYVYQADSAASPVWNHVGSAGCPANGAHTLTVDFQLGDTSGEQVIRAAFYYETAATPCDNNRNTYNERDDVVLTVASVQDADGDGMPDSWEILYGCMQPNTADDLADYDSDGLLNVDEYANSGDPCDPDTDGDGLNDGDEVHQHGSDPTMTDTDGDGLSDYDEVTLHLTDPALADTESDGIPDGWEVDNGLDPLVNDAGDDPDSDGLTNIEEYGHDTDPFDPDTDGGGENDGSEAADDKDPLNPLDDGGELAGYDATLTCPSCTTGYSPCTIREALIMSRDGQTGLPEPNQPNTIATSACADGSQGEYLDDESTDKIIVTSQSGGIFNPGDTVTVNAEVWCWGIGSINSLYVYHADSVTTPTWTLMGTDTCQAFGYQNLSATFQLGPDPGEQVIRTAFTYNSAAASCDAGGYNDRDDLVLTVIPWMDSDADGLSDSMEMANCTDETNPDSDGDGLCDGDTAVFDGATLLCAAGEDINLNGVVDAGETDPCNSDTDGDGMPDGWEVDNGLDPLTDDSASDPDIDGLTNLEEYNNGTNPNVADTDGDGMPDGWEVDNSLDPLTDDSAADPDIDGLTNLEEYNNGTNPNVADTDGDGMPDGWEVANSLDPLTDDSASDPDIDGLTNLEEYNNGTNPNVADTDGDGMPDGWEVANSLDPLTDDSAADPDIDGLTNLEEYNNGTNPNVADTDGDGMPDGWEVANSLDPLTDDSAADPDIDGLTNLEEYNNGTNPNVADTDGDGMPDGWEVGYNSCVDPVTADAAGDPDGDSSDNLAEYGAGTDPCVAQTGGDSDGDGLSDVDEGGTYGTNPYEPDSDNDGVGDYEEVIVSACLDPLINDTDGDGILDGGSLGEDMDGDGVVDSNETDPCKADSDDDGLEDGDEDSAGTDPLWWDTDGDALPDGFEVANQTGHTQNLDALDPSDGCVADFDGDGNPNCHEYYNGSDLWATSHTGAPGCYYWAESGNTVAVDGLVSPLDVAALNNRVILKDTSYTGVLPPNGDTQELDMDEIISPLDTSIITQMVNNIAVASVPAKPVDLEPVGGLTVSVEVGYTVRVSAGVLNAASKYTSGLGVIFAIDPSSTGSGLVLGGEGNDGAAGRYDVSGPIASGGRSSVVIRVDSTGTILVTATIPQCGADGRGRYCDAIPDVPVKVIVAE